MDCFALQFRFMFVVQILNQTCPFYVVVHQKCADWTNCERPSLSASSISELLNAFQLNLVLVYKNCWPYLFFSHIRPIWPLKLLIWPSIHNKLLSNKFITHIHILPVSDPWVRRQEGFFLH
jgi:hypothetical protein